MGQLEFSHAEQDLREHPFYERIECPNSANLVYNILLIMSILINTIDYTIKTDLYCRKIIVPET